MRLAGGGGRCPKYSNKPLLGGNTLAARIWVHTDAAHGMPPAAELQHHQAVCRHSLAFLLMGPHIFNIPQSRMSLRRWISRHEVSTVQDCNVHVCLSMQQHKACSGARTAHTPDSLNDMAAMALLLSPVDAAFAGYLDQAGASLPVCSCQST